MHSRPAVPVTMVSHGYLHSRGQITMPHDYRYGRGKGRLVPLQLHSGACCLRHKPSLLSFAAGAIGKPDGPQKKTTRRGKRVAGEAFVDMWRRRVEGLTASIGPLGGGPSRSPFIEQPPCRKTRTVASGVQHRASAATPQMWSQAACKLFLLTCRIVVVHDTQQEGHHMRIGILGAGNVGGTLGQAWAKKGHEVYLAFTGTVGRDFGFA